MADHARISYFVFHSFFQMEQLQREQHKRLYEWTRTLLDHRANNAKHSREKVEVSFRHWDTALQESQNAEANLHDSYIEHIDRPRQEAKEALEIYEQEQRIAGSPRTYPLFPGEKAEALQNPIYTRYHHPRYL